MEGHRGDDPTALLPSASLHLDAEDREVLAWLESFSSRHAFTGQSLAARQARATAVPTTVSMVAEVVCFERFAKALGTQRGFQQVRTEGNRVILHKAGRTYEIDCLLRADYAHTETLL